MICVICGVKLNVPERYDNRTLLACLDCVIKAGGYLSKVVLPIPPECLGLDRAVVGIS
jgi:hypothetical protein